MVLVSADRTGYIVVALNLQSCVNLLSVLLWNGITIEYYLIYIVQAALHKYIHSLPMPTTSRTSKHERRPRRRRILFVGLIYKANKTGRLRRAAASLTTQVPLLRFTRAIADQ